MSNLRVDADALEARHAADRRCEALRLLHVHAEVLPTCRGTRVHRGVRARACVCVCVCVCVYESDTCCRRAMGQRDRERNKDRTQTHERMYCPPEEERQAQYTCVCVCVCVCVFVEKWDGKRDSDTRCILLGAHAEARDDANPFRVF